MDDDLELNAITTVSVIRSESAEDITVGVSVGGFVSLEQAGPNGTDLVLIHPEDVGSLMSALKRAEPKATEAWRINQGEQPRQERRR